MTVWLWHWNQSPIVPMETSRRSKTEKSTSSSVKCEGFVHSFLGLQWRGDHEFLIQCRTVYYLEVMRPLHEAIRQKRTELWKNQSYILHHDNATAHTSMLGRTFLAKNIKFGQMWRFCSLLSSIAMPWCIMNSCHEIVRSIRNTTLKLSETHRIVDFSPW